MRSDRDIQRRDLVLVGGGHAHVLVLKKLAMEPVAGLRVSVISREVHTPYSGMLPGLIAGHYAWDDIHIDLAPLCAMVGARLIAGTVRRLDLSARTLVCDARPPIRFDLLSIDCGAAPGLGAIDGADRVGAPVKPISGFLPHWQALLERLRASGQQRVVLTIVGGGAGGVELALAADYRLRDVEGLGHVRLNLVNAGEQLLVGHNAGVRMRLVAELEKRGIEVYRGAKVVAAEAGRLQLESGDALPADEVLWVTDAAPQSWPAQAGLAVDEAGFIRVNEYLQSASAPQVFAAGDIASLDGYRLPKAGVFAVRQGPVLARNLIAAACGDKLKPYRPQRHILSLISTGDRRAVASRGAFVAAGAWVWRWKDWIDRRFMSRFVAQADAMECPNARHRIPASADQADPGDGMRCGGCGAKLGADLLGRVLERLNIATPPEAIAGVGDDAAVLRPVANALEVQSVDGFRAMIDDPYLVGLIAAEHALNDVYAMGGQPRTAMAWVAVPHAEEELMEDDLYQSMAGAVHALEEAGAALVGGHSGEATELSVGFAVSGTVDEHDVWRKQRLTIGDRLILTKPLGTGVLLAAQMRGRCRAEWLMAALSTMQKSNGPAVPVLRRAGVRACTDVTGFGLLGHLREMAVASRVRVEIRPAWVPVLAGARQAMSGGIASSLQAVNERVLAELDARGFEPSDPSVRLLLDPQTSGGLLAGVSRERVETCLAELRAAGYRSAAVIGEVGAPGDRDRWGVLAA
jgi:selenide,water dikinase